MKDSSKIRRVTLNTGSIDHWVLFGIVAAEPDYRLSLALNKKLRINLRSTAPLIIHDENQADLTFSKFSCSAEPAGMIFDLISNKSGKSSLIRKMKNIDYFFVIHDIHEETEAGTFLKNLRETDCITAVFKIEPGILKDKNLKYIIHQV